MSIFNRHPVVPRNGHTLRAGGAARISGCANQKELSLEDQVDHAKEAIRDVYDGPFDFRVIAMTKGKGERLDRPELAVVEAAFRSREFDLVVFEDLGRLVRGHDAVRLLGIAVDHGTRVIVPNDCVDTAESTWEEDALEACAAHVGHNAHTSKRLKQKLKNRFRKFGGATARPIYGYVVPPGAKTYADWQKGPPDAERHILEGARILRETGNCSAVADYLNRHKVPTGPYCRREAWDGKMVRRFYRNPLLKGRPGRGFRHTVKHHGTGRRVSVPNPEGPIFQDFPHLAYFGADELDSLNAGVAKANAHYKRKTVRPPEAGVVHLRQDARYPGAHACRCWYCGRPMLWGGNGVTEHLMCAGSREWLCWNSIGFDGALAAATVADAIFAEVAALPGIDSQLRALVTEAGKARDGGVAERLGRLERDEAKLAEEQKNLADGIAALGPVPALTAKAKDLEARATELQAERRTVAALGRKDLVLPKSAAELQAMIREKFKDLAAGSPEMGRLLRVLVPEFHVYLVRLCDGGHPLPRARVRIALAGTVPDAWHVPGLPEVLSRVITLDLFGPPQRERIREQAVALAAQGLEQREIARQIPERPTQTAVFRALALDRRVRELGPSSPYVLLTEPPADYPKLRRHKNPKYRFQPLDEYLPPVL